MRENYLKYATGGLLVLGLSLWFLNWWAGRPLFIDEANLARNVFDRSVAGLFQPLDHRQYAPPLYLALTKACGTLFGYGELPLRLPAMLGGLLSVGGLILAGKRLQLGWWSLLPLGLLFINPMVLRYVGELKPYALDMGLAAALLAEGLRSLRPSWRWLLIGIVVPWLSLPAVFVLAAVGITAVLSLLIQADKAEGRALLRWGGTGLSWLASFGLLYFTNLRYAIGSRYLDLYHQSFYFPLPANNYDWSRALELLVAFPRLAFGFTLLAILLGFVVTIVSLLHEYSDRKMMLLLPSLLALAASAFGLYSLLPRLMLFMLPGWWLLAAAGNQQLFNGLPSRGCWRFLLPAAWLLILGGSNVARHYWQPLRFSDARSLVLEYDGAYVPILHHGAVPAWDYYHRIHPKTATGNTTRAREADIRQQPLPGRYVLLYDVLTQGSIRESLREDSTWATERGCKVRNEAMFRAAAVYLDCE